MIQHTYLLLKKISSRDNVKELKEEIKKANYFPVWNVKVSSVV